MNNIWNKSYLKTREERIEILKKNKYISDISYNNLISSNMLSNEIANTLIENQIGIYSLPLGIVTNFLVDNKEYIVPFVTEEPSVIAAACNSAKLIKENGGFKTVIKERLMSGQISFYDVVDKQNAKKNILKIKEKLIEIANESQKDLIKLGGGARELEVKIKEDFLIVYLHVDTLDAMGANTINTMLETISPIILDIINAKKLMAIISNYSSRCLVESSCSIKMEKELGLKIQKAIEFANIDIYRAVTNNKGILNGIDALLLALGNDFRAIDAAIHSYAVKDGKYKSLSDWKYDEEKGVLKGNLKIIMPIASFGGSIKITEGSKVCHEILGNISSRELASLAVSVGLAQNFAALKALVTVGIQKGHMKLHAKTFAIYLGANEEEINEINKRIENENKITIEIVKKILCEIRNK